jgi:hypothetical protein
MVACQHELRCATENGREAVKSCDGVLCLKRFVYLRSKYGHARSAQCMTRECHCRDLICLHMDEAAASFISTTALGDRHCCTIELSRLEPTTPSSQGLLLQCHQTIATRGISRLPLSYLIAASHTSRNGPHKNGPLSRVRTGPHLLPHCILFSLTTQQAA